MKFQAFVIFAILVVMAACNNKRSGSPAEWSEEELNEWFSEGEWKHGFDVTPDESVNKDEMAIRYYREPELWEKAFTFLSEQNLQELDTGRHDIDGSNLYVTVSEYIPREEDSVRYEAHREYADIQYVVSGQEQISIVPIDETVVVEAYDDQRDVMFLSAIEANHRVATPENFFVLFPNDAHRPTVKVNPEDSSMVRKIVVKVKLNGLPMEEEPQPE